MQPCGAARPICYSLIIRLNQGHRFIGALTVCTWGFPLRAYRKRSDFPRLPGARFRQRGHSRRAGKYNHEVPVAASLCEWNNGSHPSREIPVPTARRPPHLGPEGGVRGA